MTDNTNKYLIIGGSTKCGTTSVFKYFEFHPEICPCVLKESRYFLEKEYLFLKNRKQRDFSDIRHFSELFKDCSGVAVRLEATPDCLYSLKAAENIKSELAHVKIVFILRNPFERLKSWYKFAITMGLMDASTSFKDYIKMQEQPQSELHQHLKSLEQGKYSGYLENYINIFGKENVHICFYEDLVENPNAFCSGIARFAGINPDYFNEFDFKVYNKTVQVKSVSAHNLFRRLKRSIRPFTRALPSGLRKRLKLAGFNMEQAYFAANKIETTGKIDISAELHDFIKHYYVADTEKLSRITGAELPWQN